MLVETLSSPLWMATHDFRQALASMHSSGIDMWAFYSTHYETLTKQSDVRASEHASKPVRKLIISGNL